MNHGNLGARNKSHGGTQKPARAGRVDRDGHGRRGGDSSGDGRSGADSDAESSEPKIHLPGNTTIYLPGKTATIQPPPGTIIRLAAPSVAGGAVVILPSGGMMTIMGAIGLPVGWTTIPAPSTIVAPSSRPILLPDSFVSRLPAGSSAGLAAGAMIYVEDVHQVPTEDDKLYTLDKKWAPPTIYCLAADIQLSKTHGLEVPPSTNGAFVLGCEGFLLPEPMLLTGPLRIVANMTLGGDMCIPAQPNTAQRVIPFRIRAVDGEFFEAGRITDQPAIARGVNIVAGSVIPAEYTIPAGTFLPGGATIPAGSIIPPGSMIPWGSILPKSAEIAAGARYPKDFPLPRPS